MPRFHTHTAIVPVVDRPTIGLGLVMPQTLRPRSKANQGQTDGQVQPKERRQQSLWFLPELGDHQTKHTQYSIATERVFVRRIRLACEDGPLQLVMAE